MKTIQDSRTQTPGRRPTAPNFLAPEEDAFADAPAWVSPAASTVEDPIVGSPDPWRDQLLVAALSGLLRHKLLAMFLVALCGVAAGLMTLRMQPYYIATATIFPAVTDSPMGALGIPGIASLVGSLGGMSGGSSQFPIYENVVHSERLISALLVTKLPDSDKTVLDHLEIPETDPILLRAAGLGVVSENITYDSDKKTGLVMVSYRDRDPKVAAAVTNRILELLNDFDVSTAASLARERRKFVEARLEEAHTALLKAENQLEDFGAGNLRIGRAPDLLLEQARLEREMSIQQEVYLALRKEVEMTRIEEARTVPAINVLDRASAPLVPAGPSLVRNVALSLVLGTILVFGLFVLFSLSPRQIMRRLNQLDARV